MAQDSTTNKSKSASPARKTVWPSSNEHELARGFSAAISLASSCGNAMVSDSDVATSAIAGLYPGNTPQVCVAFADCWTATLDVSGSTADGNDWRCAARLGPAPAARLPAG